MKSEFPRLIAAQNDSLVDEHGNRIIDLFSANGTTWLGHCNPIVTAAVTDQMRTFWITGGLEAPICSEAKSLVDGFFPPSHACAVQYSTGMEAAEFAIRVARSATGRNEVIGFEKSMHGKSMATAHLGWDNRDGLDMPQLHRIPFVHETSEAEVLQRLERKLEHKQVSAVFVEPMQGSGGGHMASPKFYQRVARLCRDSGTLSVFDEILSGFHRTGSAFLFCDFDVVPDIVLIGKAMGNGFPVSGVVARRDISITPDMLPGSTYAGNPLASAAVAATLKQLRLLDALGMVKQIERIICESLAELPGRGVALRGKGAMWIIETSESMQVRNIAERIYRRGTFVSFAGRSIRILPAITIELDNLKNACEIVRDEVLRACHA